MRISDWSSDVCSSDLGLRQPFEQFRQQPQQECRVQPRLLIQHVGSEHIDDAAATEIDAHEVVEIERRLAEEMLGAIGFELQTRALDRADRSEERRVGKEWGSTCRARW